MSTAVTLRHARHNVHLARSTQKGALASRVTQVVQDWGDSGTCPIKVLSDLRELGILRACKVDAVLGVSYYHRRTWVILTRASDGRWTLGKCTYKFTLRST